MTALTAYGRVQALYCKERPNRGRDGEKNAYQDA